MRRIALIVAISTVLGAALGADNWPQWRGPEGVGVTREAGLPERWSATENVAWRVGLPGLGVSTPVVWGDRVFVTSQAGAGVRRSGSHPSLVQGADAATAGERTLRDAAKASSSDTDVRFVVSALGWADGRQIWRHDLEAEGDLPAVHDKHNLATASPVTDGEIVVAWFGTGQVIALDAATGRRRWARHLGREFGAFEINWGHASSPILHGDLAILICYHESSSYLLALDKKTGEVRWRRERTPGAQSYSTPLAVTHGGRTALIVNSSLGIEAYDPASGAPLWHVPEANRFPIPMPVYLDGIIYTSRGYRSSPYMAIRLGGIGDVSDSHVVWRTPTGAPYVSSLVLYEGLIYMATELGIVTAVDIATGQQVWRQRIGGVFTASPVAGDGKVFLVSETGETVVLRAGRTPDIIARNRVDAHLVASPALSRGRLFLRADGELLAIAETPSTRAGDTDTRKH
jgi:outer membrane protein assembly factor BamB